MTLTMPGQRSRRIAACPQATTRPAVIPACLLAGTGRAEPLRQDRCGTAPGCWKAASGPAVRAGAARRACGHRPPGELAHPLYGVARPVRKAVSAHASAGRVSRREAINDPLDRIRRQLWLRHKPDGGALGDQIREVGLRMGRDQDHHRTAAL